MTIFRNDLFKCLKQYIFIKFKNIPVFYCYGALVNPKTNKLSSKSHPIAISFIFMRHFIYLFVIFVSSFWKALIKHILNDIVFFHCNIFILDFLKRKSGMVDTMGILRCTSKFKSILFLTHLICFF